MNFATYTTKLKSKTQIQEALQSFRLLRTFSESELETLEILDDATDKKILEKSLQESKKNEVYPIDTIL